MPSGKGRQSEGAGGREVIFEFNSIGASVKVTAVDVETGVEVSVIGPAHAPQRELERIAVQKLKHRLGLDAHKPDQSKPVAPKKPDGSGPDGGDRGGGILV